MSLCVIILEQDRIFIAGDSRTSIGIDGEKYALGEGKKIMQVEDMIIFRSGNESITRHALADFIESKNRSMEKLQQLTNKHVQRFKNQSIMDLGHTRHAEFIVARFEGMIPVIYSISSTSPDSITRIEGETSTMYLSIGGDEKTNGMLESLNGVLDNEALFETIYNAHSSETIGGTLTHYYLDKDQLVVYSSPITDSRPIKYASEVVGLDAINGLVITRSDNKVKASFNATDGLKFQKNTGTASSPTWTDMLYYDGNTGNLTIDGVINARDLKVNGSSVLTIDNKIKALAVETLEVGKNVIMGANATISWSNVTNQPNIPALPSYISATQITGAYIASPSIYGGTITIGSGDNIFKADANGVFLGSSTFANAPFRVDMNGQVIASNINIIGGSISVATNATIGNNLYLGVMGSTANRAIWFDGTRAAITFDYATDTIELGSLNGVSVTSKYLSLNGEQVATEKWVRENSYAMFS